MEDKIRKICTYQSDFNEGTAGYSLSEEQFQELFDLFKEEMEKAYGKGYDDGFNYVVNGKPKRYEKN